MTKPLIERIVLAVIDALDDGDPCITVGLADDEVRVWWGHGNEPDDAALLDFGAWLAEEVGQPLSPVDLRSCLEDWRQSLPRSYAPRRFDRSGDCEMTDSRVVLG